MPSASKPVILLRGKGKSRSTTEKQEAWLIKQYTKRRGGEKVETILSMFAKRFKKSICRKTFYNILHRNGAQMKRAGTTAMVSSPGEATSLPSPHASESVHEEDGPDSKT